MVELAATVVYLGPTHPSGDPLQLLQQGRARRLEDGALLCAPHCDGSRPLRLYPLSTVAAVRELAGRMVIDLLVVDTRQRTDNAAQAVSAPWQGSRAQALLDALYATSHGLIGIQRDHVFGVVSADAAGTAAAFELGKAGIATVLCAPAPDLWLQAVQQSLAHRPAGRVALCLAGGGIEGLLYELGVLRALEAFMADQALIDFDFFCGISAGAVLSSFLANGLGPVEIARGLEGRSARLEAISRRDIFDLNLRGLAQRSQHLPSALWRASTRSGPQGALGTLLPCAMFAGDRLRHYLKRQLTRPGMSDDFRALRRPLYIGATDQDRSEAVIFGDSGRDHIPVHRAVRASAALIPFYEPEVIEGRHYIDGAFTRTTNMRLAVEKGATLVILVDPLVPSRAIAPGDVSRRGGAFAAMQGLKTLVNGRFDKAVRAIADMYPEVNFYLFRPQDSERELLAGSPMRYFYRREIEHIAYQSTLRKIRAALPQMQVVFARHGITLRDPERDDIQDSLHERASLVPEALGA